MTDEREVIVNKYKCFKCGLITKVIKGDSINCPDCKDIVMVQQDLNVIEIPFSDNMEDYWGGD